MRRQFTKRLRGGRNAGDQAAKTFTIEDFQGDGVSWNGKVSPVVLRCPPCVSNPLS